MVVFFYKKEYSRGFENGLKEGQAPPPPLPEDKVEVVLELPPHLFTKLVAHLGKFGRDNYIPDEITLTISKDDYKLFSEFAYNHSLGLSKIKK